MSKGLRSPKALGHPEAIEVVVEGEVAMLLGVEGVHLLIPVRIMITNPAKQEAGMKGIILEVGTGRMPAEVEERGDLRLHLGNMITTLDPRPWFHLQEEINIILILLVVEIDITEMHMICILKVVLSMQGSLFTRLCYVLNVKSLICIYFVQEQIRYRI